MKFLTTEVDWKSEMKVKIFETCDFLVIFQFQLQFEDVFVVKQELSDTVMAMTLVSR